MLPAPQSSQPTGFTTGQNRKMDERRRQLRMVVYQGDGAAIVATVEEEAGEGAVPGDALQLVGDGLCAALAQHATGADRLAASCARALRERDLDGDDDLADQLEAALGHKPTPMLRRLPVDLENLAGILEGNPIDGGGRIDLTSGEVWTAAAIDYARETGEEDEDDAEDSDRWLGVECEGSRDGYRDMERFAGTVTDPALAGRLDVALGGRGAFRRFKDVLAAHDDQLEHWYGYSEERQRGRARSWLTRAGYTPASVTASHPDPDPPPET